jgi:D-lactate dehydrogenase
LFFLFFLFFFLQGFGCKVLCYDVFINKELQARQGVTYTDLDTIFKEADFISLHAPLTPQTKYLINAESLGKMKKNCILINTSRGGLVDTKALVDALQKETISGAGLDVYEQERDYFFQDKSAGKCGYRMHFSLALLSSRSLAHPLRLLSNSSFSKTTTSDNLLSTEDKLIEDETLRALISMKNVVLTGHQAFFTSEAVNNIAKTTLENIATWKDGKKGRDHPNGVRP